MKNQSVQALLEDIRLVSEQNYEIVEAVRPWYRRLLKQLRKRLARRHPVSGRSSIWWGLRVQNARNRRIQERRKDH